MPRSGAHRPAGRRSCAAFAPRLPPKPKIPGERSRVAPDRRLMDVWGKRCDSIADRGILTRRLNLRSTAGQYAVSGFSRTAGPVV